MDEKKTTKGRGFSSPLMMAISLIAASVGTGNIWRFPRVMATNGGSAFVVAYVVIMLIAVIVFTLLASVGAPTAELWLLLGATVATGILGLIDDASKVAHERSLGLTPKAKLIGQFLIAAVFVLVAVNLLGIKPTVEIPFVATLDLGVLTTVVPVGDGIAIPWLYLISASSCSWGSATP